MAGNATIGVISIGMSVGTAGLKKGLSTASSAVSGFASSTRSTIDSVVTSFAKIGLAIEGVKKIAGALSEPLRLAAEAEQTAVSFEVLLGSAEAAQGMLGDLRDFAASTSFQFPEIANSAKKLVAFGVSAEEVVPNLKRLGDIAAGLGIPFEELSEIYGKAKVSGRLFMEDINQLAGRGIPIQAELAKQFGVSADQVRELVSSGKVNFDNLQKAIESLTGEGGKFAGLMEAQSKTLGGVWSTLKDNISIALMDIGNALVDTFDIKAIVGGAISGIQSFLPTLKSLMASVGGVVKNAVAYLSGLWAQYSPAIMDAFGQAVAFVKPVIESLGGTLASVGGTIMGIVERIGSSIRSVLGPVFEGIGPMAQNAVGYAVPAFNLLKSTVEVISSAIGVALNYLKPVFTTVFSIAMDVIGKFYDFATPIIQSVSNFFTEKLVPVIDAVGPVFSAAGGMVSSAMQAMYEIVSNVVSYMMDGFRMMGEYIGEAMSWISNSLTSVGMPSFAEFRDFFIDGFIIMEYTWKNWQAVGEYALKRVAVSLIAFGGEVVHTFTKRIPAVVMWFSENWKEIINDVVEFSATTFKNLGSNIVNIIKNIPKLIKGEVSFGDLWTPLLEGAEFQLKKLPDIPARQMGEMEKALRKDVASLGSQLADGAGEYLTKRRAELFPPDATKEAEKLNGVMKNLSPAELMPAQEEMKKQAEKTGEVAASAIQGELDKIKPPSAVLYGSAEAASMIAEHYNNSLDTAKKIDVPSVPKTSQTISSEIFSLAKIEAPSVPKIEAPQIQPPHVQEPTKLAAAPAQTLVSSAPTIEREEATTATPPAMIDAAAKEIFKKLNHINEQQLLELQQQTMILNRIAAGEGSIEVI